MIGVSGGSMSAAPKRRMTPEEYLTIERAASFKSEFYRGEMVAMAGARLSHNRLIANLIRLIGNQLEGSQCFVLSNDMRVKSSKNKSYFYPDMIIVCGKPELEDNVFDTLLNPQILVEVLSESTEKFDLGDKFTEYRNIASLQEYVLVSQNRMQILRYVRLAEDHWDVRIFKDETGEFSLGTVKASVPLKDIYEGVEFSSPVEQAEQNV